MERGRQSMIESAVSVLAGMPFDTCTIGRASFEHSPSIRSSAIFSAIASHAMCGESRLTDFLLHSPTLNWVCTDCSSVRTVLHIQYFLNQIIPFYANLFIAALGSSRAFFVGGAFTLLFVGVFFLLSVVVTFLKKRRKKMCASDIGECIHFQTFYIGDNQPPLHALADTERT
jgi:hypothetical protein